MYIPYRDVVGVSRTGGETGGRGTGERRQGAGRRQVGLGTNGWGLGWTGGRQVGWAVGDRRAGGNRWVGQLREKVGGGGGGGNSWWDRWVGEAGRVGGVGQLRGTGGWYRWAIGGLEISEGNRGTEGSWQVGNIGGEGGQCSCLK